MTENPLTRELRAARGELVRAWESLPDEVRHQAPEGRWTGAQVLEHLALTQGQVIQLAARLLEAGERAGVGPGGPGEAVATGLDHLDIPDRTRRFQAPHFAEPRTGQPPEESWDALASGLESLLALAERVAGLEVSRLRAPHPLLGELDLHQWILFAAHHERRHAGQLRELAEEAREG